MVRFKASIHSSYSRTFYFFNTHSDNASNKISAAIKLLNARKTSERNLLEEAVVVEADELEADE